MLPKAFQVNEVNKAKKVNQVKSRANRRPRLFAQPICRSQRNADTHTFFIASDSVLVILLKTPYPQSFTFIGSSLIDA